MATTKKMASTAKRTNKKAIIVAMTALTGATIAQETAAYEQAMRDMRNQGDLGHVYSVQYTWDPFDGLYA